MSMIILMFLILMILIFLGIPIAFSLGISSLITIIVSGVVPLTVIPQRMFVSVDSFSLLAVPLFMLVGSIMNEGRIGIRLFRFANVLVGHIKGGLAHVNILASMIFAGMSGSATADAAGLGPIEISAMIDRGFDRDFSCAITATSALIGPIIPPSINMVIFGVLTGTSVIDLFLGGVFPGILMGLALMIYSYLIAKRRNYPVEPLPKMSEAIARLRESFWALLTPVLIMGGLLSGVFTATEASAVGVFYVLFISIVIYKDLSIKKIPGVLSTVGRNTASVLIVIGTGSLFGWLLTIFQLHTKLEYLLKSIVNGPQALLLVITLIWLVAGMFLNASVAMVMLLPVLFPITQAYGISPVHFGVVTVMTLTLGAVTPPVGLVLYVTSIVGKISLERLVAAVFVPLLFLIGTVLIVAYFPWFITFLPSLF